MRNLRYHIDISEFSASSSTRGIRSSFAFLKFSIHLSISGTILVPLHGMWLIHHLCCSAREQDSLIDRIGRLKWLMPLYTEAEAPGDWGGRSAELCNKYLLRQSRALFWGFFPSPCQPCFCVRGPTLLGFHFCVLDLAWVGCFCFDFRIFLSEFCLLVIFSNCFVCVHSVSSPGLWVSCTVKSRAVDRSTIQRSQVSGQRSQYVRIKFPIRSQKILGRATNRDVLLLATLR